jgi:heat shock protein HtpX
MNLNIVMLTTIKTCGSETMFNMTKTAILMAAITALFVYVGGALGGPEGMLMALLMAIGMNFFSYWNSDKMVLRMFGAKQVDEQSFPAYYNLIKELSVKAGLPMPKVYLIEENAPNAFATGRNPENAAVAATSGIMNILNERELRGVMSHELAHVKNRDILLSTIAATMAGAIASLANFAMFSGGRNREQGAHPLSFLLIFLAPLAASLIQMTISRAREYEADRVGSEISGDPLALASALKKIESTVQGVPFDQVENHPAVAQMMIMNPLSGGGLRGLFSTHPATEERVNKLIEMSKTGTYPT